MTDILQIVIFWVYAGKELSNPDKTSFWNEYKGEFGVLLLMMSISKLMSLIRVFEKFGFLV